MLLEKAVSRQTTDFSAYFRLFNIVSVNRKSSYSMFMNDVKKTRRS